MAQLNPTSNHFISHPPRIKGLQQQQENSMLDATCHNEACKHKEKSYFSDDIYSEGLCVKVISRSKCIQFDLIYLGYVIIDHQKKFSMYMFYIRV